MYSGRRLLMDVRLKNRLFENIYIFMVAKTLFSPVGSYFEVNVLTMTITEERWLVFRL